MRKTQALALVQDIPARVRRLPKLGAPVSVMAHEEKCKTCGKLAKTRLAVDFGVIGTLSVRMCSKCIKRFKTGAKFIHAILEGDKK